MQKLNLYPREIDMALKLCFLPGLKYPMTLTTIKSTDWKKLERKLYKIMLPKMGIRQSTSVGIRYGTIQICYANLCGTHLLYSTFY